MQSLHSSGEVEGNGWTTVQASLAKLPAADGCSLARLLDC